MSASSALRGRPHSLYTITCTRAPGLSLVPCAVEASPSTLISRGESRRSNMAYARPILTRASVLLGTCARTPRPSASLSALTKAVLAFFHMVPHLTPVTPHSHTCTSATASIVVSPHSCFHSFNVLSRAFIRPILVVASFPLHCQCNPRVCSRLVVLVRTPRNTQRESVPPQRPTLHQGKSAWMDDLIIPGYLAQRPRLHGTLVYDDTCLRFGSHNDIVPFLVREQLCATRVVQCHAQLPFSRKLTAILRD